MAEDDEVDAWFAEKQHPLFADPAAVDRAADELQAVIRAWCATHEPGR